MTDTYSLLQSLQKGGSQLPPKKITQNQYVGSIGGPGKVVQIDESKFGTWKFNKGNNLYNKEYVK